MRYIRIEDGVFDLSHFKFEKGDIDQSKVGSKQDCYVEQHDIEYCWHKCIWVKDIIAQANTIEELCDEFVYNDKTFKHVLYKDFNVVKQLCSLRNEYSVYGAIWTYKGLIYVAKMNDKGNLELL